MRRSTCASSTTVRADLLDRPLEHPVIGHLVGAGSYVLAPLSPAELDEAIVQPAARVGVTFEDGVVADLDRRGRQLARLAAAAAVHSDRAVRPASRRP